MSGKVITKYMEMGNDMKWKRLFERHILDRGYVYYCENVVEKIKISRQKITADVIGTDDYEVEISINNGAVTEMYCSCPYAEDGRNCKHMVAVLYEWENSQSTEEQPEKDTEEETFLFSKIHTVDGYQRKIDAIQKLVDRADVSIVKSYLSSILAENEKLLVRFNSILNEKTTGEDVGYFIEQVDDIAERYLGRERFISYYKADDFIFELEDILDEDVRRMIDNGDYMSAFELMNYIFALIGDVDMDDSNGGTGMLADKIYQFWLELLTKVNNNEKQDMFRWFTTHLDGSIIDYLEEFIEQIIMEDFCQEEYDQQKLLFIKEMIKKSELKDSDWSRSYSVGKWATRYLSIIETRTQDKTEIEEFCRQYWNNSSVRRYYIDLCMEAKEYDKAIKVLDESIALDKNYRGLIADYSKQKKEIFLLKGDKEAYIGQLWDLILESDAGNVEIYKELKSQYSQEEWTEQREVIFERLPKYANVDRLYKEEKLYDRLLVYVLQSPGLYALQEYASVLKKDYHEQILEKYRDEVNQMAAFSGDRKKYKQLVALLHNMQKISGGKDVVQVMVAEWKIKYRNRPAMMDELRRL